MSTSELDRKLHASVMKREATKEAQYRAERAKLDEEVQLGFGATEMSKAELRKIIDSDKRMYYRTEELNDKLYIHYKGWKELKNLEGWTGLRALYAECNAFDRISGLDMCANLRSLFLQENAIRRISGLENCPNLWNLNLNNNFIERIEGLSHLKNLNTLTIQKNKIGINGLEDVEHLRDTTISTLDIQDNKIWDPDVLPEVLMQMKDLRVLYLKGNPCSKKIPNYRKGITACNKTLKYLDDRPVFPEDRRTAEAFNRGGLEEERAERRRIREENNLKHERNMKAFQDMIDRSRAEKRERDAMRKEDKYTNETDPVESNEQRMQKQVDKWREENAEDLKDENLERAKRSLAEERARGTERPEDDAAIGGSDDEPNIEDDDEKENEQENKKESVFDDPKEGLEKKKDNRKLVYEDIWDDVPPVSSSTSKAVSSTSAPSRPKAAPASNEASSEVFLPWASGSGVSGLDAVGPSENEVERRVNELSAKPKFAPPPRRSAESSSGGDSIFDDSKPAWYSRYAEKAREAQEAPTEDPPAATTAGKDSNQDAELDEMD
eukprot:TRINITY_DN3381_c3_g1_i1.p1 TRINITY_DN3381_c3_g1~~TRINITY_DN3381_c3_g1_i1.p1  ORF type:complete len:552 (-),score=135.33 TRINITY_DN3381_c3_g1_i1:165-1820(-)